MTITATRLEWKIASSEKGTNTLAPATVPVELGYLYTTSVGTSSGKADQVVIAERTLSGSGSDSLDLAGGVGNIFGGTVTIAKVVAIGIVNTSTTTGDILVVGGAASNAFSTMFADATDKIKVQPGGSLFWASPLVPADVTATTGDILQVTNAGSNSVTYRIIIVGRSA